MWPPSHQALAGPTVRLPTAPRSQANSAMVYLSDLEHKRLPDLPPGMVKLRLVKGD